MITKEEFESLFDENITKKEYDRIIAEIDKRFVEICNKFLVKTDKQRAWFDYGNCSYDSEESSGFFDPHEYKEEVQIGGCWIETPEPYDAYFPTHWLWSSFALEMKETIANHKKEEKKKKTDEKSQRIARKNKIENLKKSIKAKLSPEEYKILKFKG